MKTINTQIEETQQIQAEHLKENYIKTHNDHTAESS